MIIDTILVTLVIFELFVIVDLRAELLRTIDRLLSEVKERVLMESRYKRMQDYVLQMNSNKGQMPIEMTEIRNEDRVD